MLCQLLQDLLRDVVLKIQFTIRKERTSIHRKLPQSPCRRFSDLVGRCLCSAPSWQYPNQSSPVTARSPPVKLDLFPVDLTSYVVTSDLFLHPPLPTDAFDACIGSRRNYFLGGQSLSLPFPGATTVGPRHTLCRNPASIVIITNGGGFANDLISCHHPKRPLPTP